MGSFEIVTQLCIYPTFCYLLPSYVHFDVCWQRGTSRDADDQEKTLIKCSRELTDATTHFKFEDNSAQRDRVDKLRSRIPSWILSQNITSIRGELINYWMVDEPIYMKWALKYKLSLKKILAPIPGISRGTSRLRPVTYHISSAGSLQDS